MVGVETKNLNNERQVIIKGYIGEVWVGSTHKEDKLEEMVNLALRAYDDRKLAVSEYTDGDVPSMIS